MTSRPFSFILLFLFVTVSCSQDPSSQNLSKVQRTQIDTLDLFLGIDENQISNPNYIEMLPDGRLAILDSDLLKVLIYNQKGTLSTSFGRKGKGPGEFVLPRGLHVTDSTINVVDPSLQRITQFDLDGNFIQNYNIKRRASYFGFIAAGDSMEYYTVANGYNGKLVGHRNAATDSLRYFGNAPVKDPPPVEDREAFKENMNNGEVPDAVSNDLMMEYQDNHLYVYLRAHNRLQKYNDGELIWDTKIALPVNEVIFDNFVEQYRNSRTGFAVLRYADDISATTDNIYLIWNGTREYPQQIVQVSSNGNVTNIYKLPENQEVRYTSITVDETNNRIYLASPHSAEVYTAGL